MAKIDTSKIVESIENTGYHKNLDGRFLRIYALSNAKEREMTVYRA